MRENDDYKVIRNTTCVALNYTGKLMARGYNN